MNARWAVNDDLENEFRYWLKELLAALKLGTVFGVGSGVLIGLLPRMAEHPGLDFIRDFWVYIVEFAFWLGMFLGMLWSAGKRIGAALGGSLPWQDANGDKADTARFFGQCAAFAAMIGISLWLTALTARVADIAAMADFVDALGPVTTAIWLAAGIFALVTLACRPGSHERTTVPRPGGSGDAA